MEPSNFSNFHSNGDAQRRTRRPQRPRLEEGQLLNYYPSHEDHQLDLPLPAFSLTAPSLYDTHSDASEQVDARWSEHAAPSSSSGIVRTEFGSGSSLLLNVLQQPGFPVMSSTSMSPISSSNHQTFGYTNNNNNYAHCNGPHRFPSISSSGNRAEYPHTLPGPSAVAPGPPIPDFTSYRSSIAGPVAPLWHASSYSSTAMSTGFGDNGIPITRESSTNNGGDRNISLLYPGRPLMHEESMLMMGMTQSQLASVDYATSTSTSTAPSIPIVSSGPSRGFLSLPHPPVVQPQPPLYDPHYLQPLHHQHQHHHQNSNVTFLHVPISSTTTTTSPRLSSFLGEDITEMYDPEQSHEDEDVTHDGYKLQDDDNEHEYEPGQETSTTDESTRSGVLTRKSYPCPHCLRLYSRLSRQEACINRHNNVKPYRCEGTCGTENCPMTFYGVENLNRHRRLKNKKWVCPD
ncbi:hypothetical protein FRC15_011875, partial [Serendipita sp. 397]